MLVLLMMMRRTGRVMSVHRFHVELIGDAICILTETVVRLHRGRRLHRRQMSVRLSTLIGRAVTAVRLSLTMRRRESLIVVRTATGTR